MGVNRYIDLDVNEVADPLRNLRYYQQTVSKDNKEGILLPAVVDIYNSSRQVIIEPGLIDILGNALLHLSTNSSTSLNHNRQESVPMAIMDSVNMSIEDGYVDCETDFRHSLLVTILFCVAYVLVFVVGFLGNLLTVAVVYRLPRMRSVTNYFIVSLAIADILVLMLCLPGTLMSNIFVRKYLITVLN